MLEGVEHSIRDVLEEKIALQIRETNKQVDGPLWDRYGKVKQSISVALEYKIFPMLNEEWVSIRWWQFGKRRAFWTKWINLVRKS